MNRFVLYRLSFRLAHNGKEPRRGHLLYLGKKTVTNATGTSNRRPWGNIDWIDYWKAFSKRDTNIMRCTCCGKKIGNSVLHSLFGMSAVGAHINNPEHKIDKTKPKYLIVPMCDECNNKFGETLEVKVNNIAVEEIDAQIH